MVALLHDKQADKPEQAAVDDVDEGYKFCRENFIRVKAMREVSEHTRQTAACETVGISLFGFFFVPHMNASAFSPSLCVLCLIHPVS